MDLRDTRRSQRERGAWRWRLVRILMGLVLPLMPSSPAWAGTMRYVNNRDAACGGKSPCYSTIDSALRAARPADTVLIQPGTYAEHVSIKGLNRSTKASESDRIIIEADPAAAQGSVVLTGTSRNCNGDAIRVQQSRFITLRGLTVMGMAAKAINILGGNYQNQAIHLERNRIFNTGSSTCDGGITVADGNPETVIVNNLIHANARNGIAFTGTSGGPHYVVNNTIHANGWSGVDVAAAPEIYLVNNLITANGLAGPSASGGFGVRRASAAPAHPEAIHLLNNLICGNSLGEINGPAFDPSDSGNLTPTGAEGPGVSASPGCELTAAVYANVSGPDGVAGTGDDDFTLAAVSPALDRGMDSRALRLNPPFNALFEADFSREAARPQIAVATGSLAFDVGALELTDTRPPEVTILQPLAGALVRGTIILRAQAMDSGSGVASVVFAVDGRALAPTANPDPAQLFTASVAFDTAGGPDGTHTLDATAIDRAGNAVSTTQSFIVDNTPPDTQITAGPSGEITTGDAAFAFTGTDNLTPTGNLTFAWRLDGAPYSAFADATAVTLSGLAHGNHTVEVKARDRAGNEDPTPASRNFSVNVPALQIAITDPPAGAVVPPGSLLVQGTIEAGGAEVGVAVNGIPAALQGDMFAALMWVADDIVLTATATTLGGAIASQSIPIAVGPSGSSLTLRATPAAGIAPLTVTFSVLGNPAPVNIELDPDGNGTIDFSGPSLDGQTFTYAWPGLYIPRATITDAQGNRRLVSALVEVYDPIAFDSRLQSRWTALKDALRHGDIGRAADTITVTVRGEYQGLLTALTVPLSQIDAVLTDIGFVDLDGDRAEYQMIRVDSGAPISHLVLFVKDTDAIWRLAFF